MSVLKYFCRWLQISRAKYSAGIILLTACFFNYIFNYSQNLLGFRYGQNFLDLTFSIPNLAAILIFVYLFTFVSGFRVISFAFIGLTTFQLYLNPALNAASIYQNYFSLVQLLILAYFGFQLHLSNLFQIQHKYLIYFALGLYSLVDYFLLYDSQVVVFLYALGIFFSQVKPSNPKVVTVFKAILLSFLSLNTIAGIIQIIFSQSLGLKYLGEPFLNIEITGVAKQQIGNILLLRAYGITNHPNVLGFFGISGLVLANLPKLKTFWGRWKLYLNSISILLVFISFSRISWLIAGILVVVYIRSWLSKLIATCLCPLLIVLSVERLTNSDRYRFLDLNQYFQAISVLDYKQLLFGLGIGRYPEFLFTEFQLPMWQYQPVHNLLLNLTIELGILPIVLLFLLLSYYYIVKNTNRIQKARKINLYTTYFTSKNPKRQEELDYCLKKNLDNDLINKIYLWCSELPVYARDNPKIQHIEYKKVPTFQTFIDYANQHSQEQVVVMCNSDIYFDDSLSKLKKFDLDNKFLALTRTENDSKISPEGCRDWSDRFYSFSQDTWVFEPPLKNFKADFELGKVACDNRLAAEAYFGGLRVLNPCLSIKTYHRHASQIRTWNKKDSHHGFRAFPAITKLTVANPKIQITWE